MTDKSRQQFEEWFKKEFDSEMAKYGEKLVDFVKKEQFKIWQASRECLEIDLPDASDSDSGCPNYHDGYNTAMSRVYDKLISHGVKIKND